MDPLSCAVLNQEVRLAMNSDVIHDKTVHKSFQQWDFAQLSHCGLLYITEKLLQDYRMMAEIAFHCTAKQSELSPGSFAVFGAMAVIRHP